MELMTIGFIALVYACGFGTGWFARLIEDMCRKEE